MMIKDIKIKLLNYYFKFVLLKEVNLGKNKDLFINILYY